MPFVVSEVFQSRLPEQEEYREPTRYGDLKLALRPKADDWKRAWAISRLADDIAWNPKGAARQAIAEWAEEKEVSFGTIVHRELRAAIVLVLGTMGHEQFFRYGKDWIGTPDGRRALVVPERLPLRVFWNWFTNRVIREAEASVLECPCLSPSSDVMNRKDKQGQPLVRVILDDDDELLASLDADPLPALLTEEERMEDVTRIAAALQTASPRQREFLTLIAGGLNEAEAARQLGIAPSTARVHLKRLRDNVV